jgi:prepilin-type N-terminal cleavage/methylation domain-containing protein
MSYDVGVSNLVTIAEPRSDERFERPAGRNGAGAEAGYHWGRQTAGGTMRASRGFTLIEMVMVIAVIAVLMTILFGITRALVGQQRYQTTRTRMANVETALIAYVSQSKRLPCPANGTLASTNSAAGSEAVTGTGTARDCGTQANGVVPWRDLGLTATDIEDGWGGRMTYRVGPDLVKDGAMDFTACDPGGTAGANVSAGSYCMPGCTSTLSTCTPPATALAISTTKGLVVKNTSGTIMMDPRGTNPVSNPSVTTGAAYVVISHGPEGGGAYSGDGVVLASTVDAGTEEQKNFAANAYTPPSLPVTSAPPSYLVDDVINPAAGTHFDDLVLRPGVLALALKANLGPRTH